MKVKSLSCVQLLATPWTAAYQAPTSMGFSRQEYWNGVPFRLELFMGAFSLSFLFFFPPSLWLSQFGLLSQVSSLRLPSEHSGPALTISHAANHLLLSPHLLVMDTSVWVTSPLGIAVRYVIYGFYLFIFSSR